MPRKRIAEWLRRIAARLAPEARSRAVSPPPEPVVVIDRTPSLTVTAHRVPGTESFSPLEPIRPPKPAAPPKVRTIEEAEAELMKMMERASSVGGASGALMTGLVGVMLVAAMYSRRRQRPDDPADYWKKRK